MLQELFVNACIIVTILFVVSQIFRTRELSPSAPLKVRILLGVIGGISTCIVMFFSIHITPEIVLDSRHVCELLAAIFGGPVSALVTGLIAGIFRFVYMDVSYASVIASAGILIACFGCGLISRLNIKSIKKWLLMLGYILIVRTIILYSLLGNNQSTLTVILVLWGGTVITTILVYYLVRYLVDAHTLLSNLKRESSHDFLTGLYNTRQFDAHYNYALQQACEMKRNVALLMIDIDHFKKVNDTYGHNAGDTVLKSLGLLLLKTSRVTDFVSRVGGEEFSILMEGLSKDEALEAAERIRAAVDGFSFTIPGGKKLKITISIGAAIYPEIIDDAALLKEKADMKLYEAKHAGRNRVCA